MRSRGTRPIGMRRIRILVVTLGLGLLVATALPATAQASATSPPFTECPTAGVDTSCATLITINPNGTSTVATDPSQAPFNGATGNLVGILNDSNALVSSVGLAGSSGNDIFAFNGHGLCAVKPTPCFSKTEFGPTGYEGPGTAFTVTNSNNGSVNFSGGLSPDTSTYFSLQSAPFTVSAVDLAPDIDLSASSFSATVGVQASPQVATFTDGESTAPPSEFDATIQWGDTTSSAGTVSQPGGSGTPYEVTGIHTYTAPSSYTTTVTVTDGLLALNTAMAMGSASVTNAQIITCTGSGCSGTVTGGGQTDDVRSSSTTGTILISINVNGSLACNDSYRHASNVTTITESGMPGNTKIYLKIKFPASQLVGPTDAPIAVCFQASPGVEFLDLQGDEVNTGDLPICLSPGVGHRPLPCVDPMKHSGSKGNGGGQSVVEKVVISADDPRFR